MEKFNFSQKVEKVTENAKRLIKNTVIAGSLLMSTEQGLAQEVPSQGNEGYKPNSTWVFEEGTNNKVAYSPSLKYPGLNENYILKDSLYEFEGYSTQEGENVTAPEVIKGTIDAYEAQLTKIENKEDALERRLAYQETSEYAEECYAKALADQRENIENQKKAIAFRRDKLMPRLKDNPQEYQKMQERLVEEEEVLKGLEGFLNNILLKDKQKALGNPMVVPHYTREQIISQIEFSVEDYNKKIKDLQVEYKYVHDYILSHTK